MHPYLSWSSISHHQECFICKNGQYKAATNANRRSSSFCGHTARRLLYRRTKPPSSFISSGLRFHTHRRLRQCYDLLYYYSGYICW
ncbi:hypothetical protein Q1695_002678 [Nippostrongylus brasiliensis]|nr:hypothetical protein Q1695_002678 [Nippostrongylus brasiliensis]